MFLIILFTGLFLLLLLSLFIKHEGGQRFSYVKETRKVWAGLGYEDVTYYALKPDTKGKYYSNGREIR